MSPGQDLCALLEQQADQHPDKTFVHFQRSRLTYAEARDRSSRMAAGLVALGLRAGDVLPGLLSNGEEAVLAWLACNRVGVIWAPLNTAFRGASLAHAIQLLESPFLLVDAGLVPAVEDIWPESPGLQRLFVAGEDSWNPLVADHGIEARAASSRDTSLLIFTSGTTGRSKACELSHHYMIGQARMMIECAELTADDVMYCPYPLFHLDATALTVVPSLLLGATAVIPERFSVSRFWPDIRRYGCTTFDFMGATLGFIYKQPPRPDDGDNPARLGWGVPMPAFRKAFERRFDLRLMEGYGATECGCPVWQFPGETYPPGSCGRSHPEYEVCVVNERDETLPAGETGEIVVRPRHPDMVMKGYYRDPGANARIFRIPGAVCMGDRGRLDERGNLYFMGRRSDAIRRRGENISAAEIEEVIDRHPAVLEVAALGIPSEHGEDDVAVAIVLKPECEMEQEALLGWCEGRLARHMIPSEVRFLEELPKTPTRKISRDQIRDRYFRN